MVRLNEVRRNEVAVEATGAFDAGLTFIGTIRTPWTSRLDCPRQGRADGPVCRIEVYEPWVAALDGISRRPIEPLFEPIVAPEHLAVARDDRRRSDDADLRRPGALGLESRLVGVAFCPFKRGRGIDAACGEQRRERRPIGDRQAAAEFSQVDLTGKVCALLALKRQRDAGGEQARLGKGLRPFERDAHRLAGSLEVAPHIAALGGIEVERRVPPALRSEDRPEQERAPHETHAPRLGELADPERRRVGIGAREFVPELRPRHCAAPGSPGSLS